MTATISDIDELNKIVRKYLVSQSELPEERVRNSLSMYGETLDKWLFKQTFDTICYCDTSLLFELRARDSDNNKSMTESDGSILTYKSYTMYLIMYGSKSATVMNKLLARMRTQAVRLALQDEGVFIEEVRNDVSVNEYKNDTMWERHDAEIRICCKMLMTQIELDSSFERIDPINITVKGDKE